MENPTIQTDIAEILNKLDGKFDKLDTKLDKLSEDVDNKFDKLSEDVDNKFDKLDANIDKLSEDVDNKFDKLNAKIDKLSEDVDNKFDKLSEDVDNKLEKIDGRLNKLEVGQAQLTVKVDNIEQTTRELKETQKRLVSDVSDLKGAKSLIIPIVVAVTTSILTLVIRAIPINY